MRVYYAKDVESKLEEYPDYLTKQFNKFTDDIRFDEILPFTKIGNISLFKARLNIKARVIFTHLKIGEELIAVVLELLPEHEYENSKVLNQGTITIEKLRGELDYLKQKLKNEQNAHLETLNNNNAHTINLDQLEYAKHLRYLNKFIEFDERQEEVVEYNLPLVVNGSAGSGKTSVALEKLRQLEEKVSNLPGGKILYITLSKKLAEESARIYKPCSEEGTRIVDFLYLDNFLKTKIDGIQNKVPVTRKVFLEWFNNKCKSPEFKKYKHEGNKVFEEFTAVIATTNLSKEDYIKLGLMQSIFNNKERVKIYDFYNEYKKFIVNSGRYYDTNLILEGIENDVLKPEQKYDAVVVDEVQDFTFRTLSYVLKHLNDEHYNQFLLCGDTHQIIHPTFFSISRLENFLNKQKEVINATYHTLTENHRNSEAVVNVANKILRFKNKYFDNEDKISETAKKCFFMTSSTKIKGNVSLIDKQMLQKSTNNIAQSVNWAVVILDNEFKDEAKQLFNTPLIFTIEEIKGLEFSNIIFFITKGAYKEVWDYVSKNNSISSTDIRNQLTDEHWSARSSKAKNKEDKTFKSYEYMLNTAYVAFTRAIENIYIIKGDSDKLWEVLTIDDDQVNPKTISVVASTIEEYTALIIKLIKTGNFSQAQGIVNSNIASKNTIYTSLQVKEAASIIDSELSKLVTQNSNHSNTSKIESSEFEDLRTELRKLLAKYDVEKSTLPTEVEPTTSNAKERLASKLSIKDFKETKAKNDNVKHMFAKEGAQEKITEISKERAQEIIRKACNNIQSIYEVTAEELEQKCQSYLNKTSLSIIISLLPKLIEDIKDPNKKKEKINNEFLLTNFIKKITPISLNDRDISGKSALDYLIEYKIDPEAKRQSNILGQIGLLISNDKDCLNKFIKALGQNLFKLDSMNWPILCYFDPLQLERAKVDSGIKQELIKQKTIPYTKYDACHNGLEMIFRSKTQKKMVSDLKYMIDKKANLDCFNDGDETVLHIAAWQGHESVVKLLLGSGASMEVVNKGGFTPLHLSAQRGHNSIINLLLSSGADKEAITKDDATPLHLAAEEGHESVVELLLGSGANMEAGDKYSHNALHMAAQHGHESVVVLLLKYGSNVNVKGDNEATPLHLAAEQGHESVVKVLLGNGANKEATTKDGATPLHSAVAHGRRSAVKILLDNEVNKEAITKSGYTALHMAAQQGHESVAKLLLENKASISVISKNVIFELAEHTKDQDLKTLINNKLMSFHNMHSHDDIVNNLKEIIPYNDKISKDLAIHAEEVGYVGENQDLSS